MNRLLVIIGSLCTMLWAFVTAMTTGLSQKWCQILDQLTFHKITPQVFQLANGFYYDTPNHDMPTVIFLALFGIIFVLVFVLTLIIERRPVQKYTLAIILFFSVLFRLILLPGELIHENDIYRYLWDGKSLTEGINPYKYAPADLFMYEQDIKEDFYDVQNDALIKAKDFTDRDKAVLDRLINLRDENPVFYERIGYKEVPTIYPPVAQIVFMLSSVIKRDSIFVMKSLFVLFDLAVIGLIIALLKHFGKNPALVIIYAWSPLVLKEFANSGHYDTVAIFFTLLAVLAFVKKENLKSVGSLALATLSKFYSIILGPLLWRSPRRKEVLLFLSCAGILYLPFFVMNQTGFTELFAGLNAYNQEWAYNASIFSVIYQGISAVFPHLADTYMPAKTMVGLIFLGILFWLFRQREKDDFKIVHQCFMALAALFILNPVGDPWYFCWVIPFLCLFPYRSWMILSALLPLSYLNFQDHYAIVNMEFLKISGVEWLIYFPFFLLLIIEVILKPKFSVKA